MVVQKVDRAILPFRQARREWSVRTNNRKYFEYEPLEIRAIVGRAQSPIIESAVIRERD